MTTSSLAIAALAALLSGQSASDRQAYAIYQAKLAALMNTPTASSAADAAAQGSSPAVPAAAATSACLLVAGAGNTATTSDCTACHATYQSQHSHPVDVYQDAGRSRSLRRASDVVARGVLLSEGRVTCLSCHDGNSKWKYKIALPPGSSVTSRVNPRDPMTYQSGLVVRAAATSLPAGSDVSPTPLCKACHGFD